VWRLADAVPAIPEEERWMTAVEREPLAPDDVHRNLRTITRGRHDARHFQVVETDRAGDTETGRDIAAVRRSAMKDPGHEISLDAVDEIALYSFDLLHRGDRRQCHLAARAA